MFNCGPSASEFDPSFRQFGVSDTPSRGPDLLSETPGRLFRGLGEVCYPRAPTRGQEISEITQRTGLNVPDIPRTPAFRPWDTSDASQSVHTRASSGLLKCLLSDPATATVNKLIDCLTIAGSFLREIATGGSGFQYKLPVMIFLVCVSPSLRD